MGTNCYRKDHERGPWFEMLSIRNCVTSKESRGEDASYERKIYAAWLKVPEYLEGDKRNRREGLYGVLLRKEDKQGIVSKIAVGIIPTDPNYETQESPVLAPAVAPQGPGRGRPRKSGEVSRVTDWRRRKEAAAQGVLL